MTGFADSTGPHSDANFDWFKPVDESYVPPYAFLPGVEPPAITSATVSQLPAAEGLPVPVYESLSGDLYGPFVSKNTEAHADALPQPIDPNRLLEQRIGPAGLHIIVQHGDPEGLGILESPYFPGLDYWRAVS